MFLDLNSDLSIYYSAQGFSHVSPSLRSQEGSGVAKKNPWQALCLGGDPLKTRCAPHFHRFCFLLLFFLHSWHASSLAPLSFHASLSRLHAHACHFPAPTSEANLEQQGHDADGRLPKTSSARSVICHYAIRGVDRAPRSTVVLVEDLGSIKTEERCFHLAWDYKVVRSQHPRPTLSPQAEDDKVIDGRAEGATRRWSQVKLNYTGWGEQGARPR